MPTFDTIISKWLSLLGIRVSGKYMKHKLQSHPDYPSMLCITDTLESLGIEHAAVHIEKEHLHEIPVPFIAHLTGNGGEWLLVKNRDNLDQKFPHFFERWKGTVLLAEKTEGWYNSENEREIEKERNGKYQVLVAGGIISLLTITALLSAGTILDGGLLISAAAGMLVGWLILTKDLGIDNILADQVCGAKADCNAVIHSKAIKLPLGLSWGDIGLIWFSFQFLYLLINVLTGSNKEAIQLLSFCSIFYLPFACFSLFYQWRVAKKWCRLCLIVVGTILVQSALLLPNILKNGLLWPEYNTIAIAILLLTIGIIAWLPVKMLLAEKRKLESDNWGLQRFKNNMDIFSAILAKQRKVDTRQLDNDLQIGNPFGAVQIVVACNPYCGPCAKAHRVLHELVESEKGLGLTIRFSINAANKEDKKTKAVEYISRLIEAKREMITDEELIHFRRVLLNDWFKWMCLDKFKTLYKLIKKFEVDEFLNQQEAWGKEAKITHTPTIFINGYELPNLYNLTDLPALIGGFKLLNFENQIQETSLMA